MTQFHPRPVWTAVTRSLRPTWGARRNAADGIADVRLSRAHRAQAVAAFRASASDTDDRRSV